MQRCGGELIQITSSMSVEVLLVGLRAESSGKVTRKLVVLDVAGLSKECQHLINYSRSTSTKSERRILDETILVRLNEGVEENHKNDLQCLQVC